MKKAWIIACVFALVSAAGFAQVPAVAGSCVQPQNEVLFALGLEKSTCTANCGNGTTVTCTAPGTCTAVDRSCPSQRGHVTCSNGTFQCPTACGSGGGAFCTDCEATGDCFSCCRCGGGTINACIRACGI